MIKKIFFLGSLVLISNLFFSQIELPINSSENKFIKKWIVAKVKNLNKDSVSNLTSNTQNFLSKLNKNNVREINLSKNLKSSISFYQLFDSIDYKTTLIATCIVEFDKVQLCGLSWGSYMFNQDIYVNGKKINSQGNSS